MKILRCGFLIKKTEVTDAKLLKEDRFIKKTEGKSELTCMGGQFYRKSIVYKLLLFCTVTLQLCKYRFWK